MVKWKGILLLFLPMLLLTGCWDKKDPEDRTFIISMGVDLSAEGCSFSFAPADIEKGEAKMLEAESRTLAGAVAQIDTRTSRKTDLGQMKTIIFSRDVLAEKEKLDALLQELERSQAVSEKVMLLATEGSAKDCVDAILAEDGKTGLFLWDFYKNTAREVAVTKGMDLDTFLTERWEQGGNAVFPRISAKEKKLEVGGGLALAGEKIYVLDDQEERGYLFLLGEAEGALLEGKYKGETLPLEIGKSDVEYVFSLQDANILCTVRLPLEGALQGGGGTFLTPEEQRELEVVFSDIIKEEILHTIGIAKGANEDLFGILPRLYQQNPEWDLSRESLWRGMVFEIQPELKLKDVGRKR